MVGCLFALAAGTWLRFTGLEDQIYRNDEAWTGLWLSGHSVQDLEAALCQDLHTAADFTPYRQINDGKGVAATLASVAVDDPKQGPVYYVLLRLWTNLAGDSFGAWRSLSVIFGLVACGLAFWLMRELFPGTRLPAWIAAGLLAISPAQILYAQDARPYSILAAATLISSGMLLRALRSGIRRSWMIYCASVVVGLYIHPLFLFVLASHAAYLVLLQWSGSLRSLWTGPVRAFAFAVLGAGLAFLPWIIVFALRWRRGLGTLRWVANPPDSWGRAWLQELGRLFVDTGGRTTIWAENLFYPLASLLILLSLWSLCGRQPWRSAGLLLMLFAVPFAALISGDLVLGGMSSTIDRYLISAFLGATLGVAWFVSSLLHSSHGAVRLGGVALWGLLLGAGIYSSWLNAQTIRTWVKGPTREHPAIGEILNREPGAVLVSDCPTVVRILSLSTYLNDQVPVVLFSNDEQFARWLDGEAAPRETPVFLFSGPIGSSLGAGVSMEPVPGTQQLWRVR